MKKLFLPAFGLFFLAFPIVAKKSKQLVFEEQLIEGKLKKPQVVLISSQSRPRFTPMAINTESPEKDLLLNTDRRIFENYQYQKPSRVRYKF